MWRWKCRARRSFGGRRPPDRGGLRPFHDGPAVILPLPEPSHRLVVGDPLRLAAVADGGLPGLAVAQQPGQSPVGFVVRRRPPGHDLRLRPGHRDVHQPAGIAGLLPPAQRLDRPVVRTVRAADVQTANVVVVEQDQVAFLHIAVEGERQVDDGELQSLAAPYRHDLNGHGIAVQPPVALGGRAALLAPVAQPVPQTRQREVLAVGRPLQQLGQVREVGEVAFAAAPAQRTLGHAPQLGGLQHRGDTDLTGVVGPLADGLGNPVGQFVTLFGEVRGGVAEEHGAGRRPDHPGAVRLVEGLQQSQPIGCGLGAEKVGIPGVDGRDAGADKGVETGSGVGVLFDDHRDIAGLDLAPVEGGLAGQQRTDVAGQVAGNELSQVADRDGLGAGPTELFPADHPKSERVVAWRAGQSAAAVVGVDVAHHDARVTQLGTQQDRLQALQQGVVAAPVLAEGPLVPRGVGRRQIGDDVPAAEGVDRLFGVPDEHHRADSAERLLDHRPLHRVGVLELVDHDDRPASAHPMPGRRGLTAQRVGQPGQQVVVAQDSAAALADFQFG